MPQFVGHPADVVGVERTQRARTLVITPRLLRRQQAGVEPGIIVDPGSAAVGAAATDIGADLHRLVSLPFEQDLKNDECLVLNVETVFGQRRLDFPADLPGVAAAVGVHRVLAADHVDPYRPFRVAVQLEGHRPIAVLPHALAVETLDIGQDPVQADDRVGLRLAVVGDEVGNM